MRPFDTVVVTTRAPDAGEIFLRCLAIFGALGVVVLAGTLIVFSVGVVQEHRDDRRRAAARLPRPCESQGDQ